MGLIRLVSCSFNESISYRFLSGFPIFNSCETADHKKFEGVYPFEKIRREYFYPQITQITQIKSKSD